MQIEPMKWRGGRLVGNGYDFRLSEAFDIVNRIDDKHKTVPNEVWVEMAEACRWVLCRYTPSLATNIKTDISRGSSEDSNRSKFFTKPFNFSRKQNV